MSKIYYRAIKVWFILLIFMIFNGMIRNEFYQLRLGELLAHQLSTVIAIIIVFIVTYIFLNKLKIKYSKEELFTVGIIWLASTILFEFVFGYFVIGHSLERLLADYNIFAGRLWILFLIVTTTAPILINEFVKKT